MMLKKAGYPEKRQAELLQISVYGVWAPTTSIVLYQGLKKKKLILTGVNSFLGTQELKRIYQKKDKFHN